MADILPPVVFVSDDDVLEHIVDISGGGTKRALKGKDKAAAAEQFLFTESKGSDNSDGETVSTSPVVSHHLYSQQFTGSSVQGTDLFKLGAQRRRRSSLYTPSKSTAAQFTADKRKRSREVADIDSNGESASPSEAEEDDEEEEDGNGTGDESESDSSAGRRTKSNSTTPAAASKQSAPKKRSKASKSSVPLSGHEEYFHLHGDNNVGTSDRTLSHLNQPMLDLQAVRAGLALVPDRHASHRSRLHAQYSLHFPSWMLYLRHGFNVLLFGLGSKRQLLEDFRENHLKDSLHLVVNGYFPGLQFKDVLNQITDHLECSLTFRTLSDRCQYICDHFRNGNQELYIVVHSIDGVALRSDKIQSYMGELASSPHIHLIASTDHINVPTMWDGSRLAQFNWLWREVHTLSNYMEETSYENSIMVRQTGKLVYTALTHVMESLTRNGRGIFKLLAEAELQRESKSNAPGMAFQDLFSHCKELFLVSSDQALRAQLTEFLDHKLVKSKKGQDGVEYLCLAVEKQIVERYLSTLSDS